MDSFSENTEKIAVPDFPMLDIVHLWSFQHFPVFHSACSFLHDNYSPSRTLRSAQNQFFETVD
jgi:hypothetical protein